MKEKGIDVIGVDCRESEYTDYIQNTDQLLDYPAFEQFIEGINCIEQVAIVDCTLPKTINNLGYDNLSSSIDLLLTRPVTLAINFGEYCKANKKQGRYVFISSIKGKKAPKLEQYDGNTKLTGPTYGIAKAGLELAVKDLSARYEGCVVYNAVAPGGLIGEDHREDFINRYDKNCFQVPGLIDPKQVSKCISMLIEPGCPIVSQTITIDQGWTEK